MLRTFTAKGFRCFRDLTIRQLERVNLIAGKNNTGKTALLEGLCLFSAPNNPILPLQLNNLRGVSHVNIDASEVWGWLFFKKNIDARIELIGEMDDTNTRTLTIQLEERLKDSIPASPPASGDTTTTAPPDSISTGRVPLDVVLNYADSTGQRGTSRASAMPIGGQVKRAALTSFIPTWFLHTHNRTPQEDAIRFSRLAEIEREEEVVAPVRILEPRLKRLAVLVSSGQPIIHGDLGEGRMVPVPYMGEGVSRLLSILLAIANASGGMILLDEIENGLHYSVMKEVWKAIAQAARQHDVQMFATTHSWECIQAAHHAFRERGPYELRYYRLDRQNKDIVAKSMDEAMLERVQYTDLEIR